MSFFKEMFDPSPGKVPDQSDPAVEEARRRRRLAASVAKGRQSTIFTGPGGVSDKRMLGAASLVGPGGSTSGG